MKPVYLLLFLPVFLLLVIQCQSHSQNPAFSSQSREHEHQARRPNGISRLWKNLGNSTVGNELDSQQRDSRKSGECYLHSHCSRHHFCSCSYYCENMYGDCAKRKREINSAPSETEEKKDGQRNQRDCAVRRGDSRSDHRCISHEDCGCGRRCSCHGYCTYICNKK